MATATQGKTMIVSFGITTSQGFVRTLLLSFGDQQRMSVDLCGTVTEVFIDGRSRHLRGNWTQECTPWIGSNSNTSVIESI